MRSTSLFVAATIGLGALTGCGGDDSVSKADFVKQANAICKKGNAELQKATANIKSEDDAVTAIKDKVVPNIQGQIEDIRDIGFPKGDKDKLEGILDKAQGILDKVKDDPKAMMSNNDDPFADINAGFKDYGLTECASS